MKSSRHWLDRNRGWALAILFVLTVCVSWLFGSLAPSATLAMALAAGALLVYFVQKQHLAFRQLSSDLFIYFNERYARLQPMLQRITGGDPQEALTADQIDLLYTYFDLCSEEYYYYCRHEIDRAAWETWLSGMRVYYYHPLIRHLWDQALTQQHYYGFDRQLLA